MVKDQIAWLAVIINTVQKSVSCWVGGEETHSSICDLHKTCDSSWATARRERLCGQRALGQTQDCFSSWDWLSWQNSTMTQTAHREIQDGSLYKYAFCARQQIINEISKFEFATKLTALTLKHEKLLELCFSWWSPETEVTPQLQLWKCESWPAII